MSKNPHATIRLLPHKLLVRKPTKATQVIKDIAVAVGCQAETHDNFLLLEDTTCSRYTKWRNEVRTDLEISSLMDGFCSAKEVPCMWLQ